MRCINKEYLKGKYMKIKKHIIDNWKKYIVSLLVAMPSLYLFVDDQATKISQRNVAIHEQANKLNNLSLDLMYSNIQTIDLNEIEKMKGILRVKPLLVTIFCFLQEDEYQDIIYNMENNVHRFNEIKIVNKFNKIDDKLDNQESLSIKFELQKASQRLLDMSK